MNERLRFVARLLEGEKMAPLCEEFGISPETGYKIFDRYGVGAAALVDAIETLVVERRSCRRRAIRFATAPWRPGELVTKVE